MDFINTKIPIQELPSAEDLDLQPIQPAYLKILRVEWLISTLVLAVIAAVLIITISSVRNSYGWMILAGTVVIISFLHYLFQSKGFPYKTFAVREKDITYRYGWITRSIKICPFNRIQNCNLQSGPLERKYGLATLVIFTAGSDGADMRIPGLLQEDAENMRHFILQKIHKEADENI
jgi:uncharacterized protein